MPAHIINTVMSRAKSHRLKRSWIILADINNKAVNVAGLKAVYNYLVDKIKSINTDIGSVYKPCGTVKFADLPEPSAETLGHVYNIEDNL